MLLRVKPSDFAELAKSFLGSEKVCGVIQVKAGETSENLASVLCACLEVLALPCLCELTWCPSHCCHHQTVPPPKVSVAASVSPLPRTLCKLCRSLYGSRNPYDSFRPYSAGDPSPPGSHKPSLLSHSVLPKMPPLPGRLPGPPAECG